MKKLTIIKDKWVRGDKNGRSCLLNEKGNMCCLGFLAKQVFGLNDEEIINRYNLSELWKRSVFAKKNYDTHHKLVEERSTLFVGYELEMDFTFVNDDRSINDENRQRKLKKMFKDIGIEVEFV